MFALETCTTFHQVSAFDVGEKIPNRLYGGFLSFRGPGVHVHWFSKILSWFLSPWYVGALLGFPVIFSFRLRTNIVGFSPLVVKLDRLALPVFVGGGDIVQGKALPYQRPIHSCGDDSFEENVVLVLS